MSEDFKQGLRHAAEIARDAHMKFEDHDLDMTYQMWRDSAANQILAEIVRLERECPTTQNTL